MMGVCVSDERGCASTLLSYLLNMIVSLATMVTLKTLLICVCLCVCVCVYERLFDSN